MEVYYAGFNGFKQVPGSSGSDTLTCLTLHSKASKVIDAAICWNYMVVAEPEGITKYGLINNRPGQANLERPPGAATVCQVSGTPRHILCVTDSGECWTHEEGKGWRRVVVVQTDARDESTVCSEETVSTLAEDDEELREPEIQQSLAESHPLNIDDGSKDEEQRGEGSENEESPVCMSRTACGDFHNLACDTAGQAYSLPSPITFSSFPGGAQQKVVDVACGKEHCMLLTEHGQVYTWGGGSRGQLGHGTLASEESPRLVMALDGMKIIKIAAGGWHSAAISEFNDLYMFGWNESGQLAQATNLARPAECFSAVEKLLMACCTMQAEDAAIPRGDTEDTECYRKHGVEPPLPELPDPEKEALNCYNAASCDNNTDLVMVQPLPMLVQIMGKSPEDCLVTDVGCGSRHTVCLTKTGGLWAFGWNKYGQLGVGDTRARDAVTRMMALPKGRLVATLRCGDWGTVVVTSKEK